MPLSASSLEASSTWQRSYSFMTAKASSSSFLNCAFVASILPSSSVAAARCLAMLACSLASAFSEISDWPRIFVCCCCTHASDSASVSSLLFCARSLMPPAARTCSCSAAIAASALSTAACSVSICFCSCLTWSASFFFCAISAALSLAPAPALRARSMHCSSALRCAEAASRCIRSLVSATSSFFASFCMARASGCAPERVQRSSSSCWAALSARASSWASSLSLSTSPCACCADMRPRCGLPPPSMVPLVLMTTPSVVTTRWRLLPLKAILLACCLSPHTSVSCSAK
mmetsp:Transcript_23020/g.54750  ORF Transcript_23020/g.54750 Transcript_23020/m.54750 type:complete len:289 (+) Transcript_23020:211-1077(+)